MLLTFSLGSLSSGKNFPEFWALNGIRVDSHDFIVHEQTKYVWVLNRFQQIVVNLIVIENFSFCFYIVRSKVSRFCLLQLIIWSLLKSRSMRWNNYWRGNPFCRHLHLKSSQAQDWIVMLFEWIREHTGKK